NEDFQLLTWDIVSNPSNKGSWVKGIYEGKEFTIPDANIAKPTEEDVKKVLKEHENKIWQVLKDFRK
ncbi:MAG: hypothetical protein ACOC1K_08285, partial [Nanoarchaeota archaeon]